MKKTNDSITHQYSIDDLRITSEDDFEVVTMYGRPRSNQTNNLYPITPPLPYSVTPNLPTYQSISNQVTIKSNDRCSHPLDGIPFKLSPALEIYSTNNYDSLVEDVKTTLSRLEKLLYSDEFEYDCTLERNVLAENHSDTFTT